MLILPANKPNIIGRLFMLALVFFTEYMLIRFGLFDDAGEQSFFINRVSLDGFHAVHLVYMLFYILVLIIAFLALTVTISLLSYAKIKIDKDKQEIIFYKPGKVTTIALHEITSYKATVHQNPFSAWQGLLIQLVDRKLIQVTEQNTKSLTVLKDWQNEKKIAYIGKVRMKFPFH